MFSVRWHKAAFKIQKYSNKQKLSPYILNDSNFVS